MLDVKQEEEMGCNPSVKMHACTPRTSATRGPQAQGLPQQHQMKREEEGGTVRKVGRERKGGEENREERKEWAGERRNERGEGKVECGGPEH